MASGNGGDSPSNAVIAAMEGGQWLNIGCNTPRWDLC